MTLTKTYNSQEVEDKIYALWEKSGFFQPKADHPKCDNPDVFSIAMPPPNATGELHIGHAMFLTIQDLLTRYHRMKGDITLWLPGTDHASIATQNKVEKILIEKEGKTRQGLGQTKFLRRVNQYVKDSQHIIRHQIRKMGSSCDWSRERYTLDAGLILAVQEMFVRMYNDGLIYRGDRIVNWCPRCESTLADDEVEYREKHGKLYYIIYKLKVKSQKLKVKVQSLKLSKFKDYIVVATTRPETMFGDTAVAVNSQDEKYRHLIGQKAVLPIVGRELIIIADKSIDPKFGTGAVKITPCHDQNDFAIGERHHLEKIKIFNDNGTLNNQAPIKYQGLDRFNARKQVVVDLKKQKLLHKIENHKHNIGYCYRCNTIIEPLTSKQWFVNVNYQLSIINYQLQKIVGKKKASLKEIALTVVKNGEIKIIPKKFEKIYYHWMENLRDWCISRQIWFGHQIPVYYKRAKKPIQITYFAHSTSVDNEKNLTSGQVDVELSLLGQKQSKELRKLVKGQKFNAVFCSDLKRATDTAKIAFGNRLKIIQDKRLREIDYGKMTQWESKKIDNLTSSKINEPFPEGESYKQVENRITDFLSEIIDKYAGKKIAIIAHKAPQLAFDVLLKEKTWEQAIASDWRKISAWQPGFEYELRELTRVSRKKISGWQQDPDTLDTWFSSGLWTFSTLGWPNLGIEVIASRHGTTDAHKPGVFVGQAKKTDFPLNKEGIKQAELLAIKLKNEKFDIIFTADLNRTYQTAKIVNKYHHVKIIKDKRLREYRFGFRNGKTFEELQRQYPDIPTWQETKINQRYKDEETPLEMKQRVESFINELKQKYFDKKTFIVTSGGILDFFHMTAKEKNFQEIKNLHHEKCGIEKYVFKNNDLANFHPTSVMETSYDILFFWVARMILMTTYVLGEVPFKTVYLHGLVRDKLGRKMSKSLGNGIDPLDMIKKYGADAVRLSLIIGITPGNDTRMHEEKIAGYRNFVTKIWNIARFIIASSKVKSQKSKIQIKNQKYKNDNLTIKQLNNKVMNPSDKWILFELGELIKRVNKNLEKFQFSRAGEDIYEFMWHKLADWYIEMTKKENLPHQPAILCYILEKCLVLLHPFVPFVTEEIWEIMNYELRITNYELLIIKPWVEKIDFKISKTEAEKLKKTQKEIIKKRNASAVKKSISEKETLQLKKYIKSLKARLKDKVFLMRAPAEVIQKEKARLREALAKLL